MELTKEEIVIIKAVDSTPEIRGEFIDNSALEKLLLLGDEDAERTIKNNGGYTIEDSRDVLGIHRLTKYEGLCPIELRVTEEKFKLNELIGRLI